MRSFFHEEKGENPQLAGFHLLFLQYLVIL